MTLKVEMMTSPHSGAAGSAALHSSDNLFCCLSFSKKGVERMHWMAMTSCSMVDGAVAGCALGKLAVEGNGHFDMSKDKRTGTLCKISGIQKFGQKILSKMQGACTLQISGSPF